MSSPFDDIQKLSPRNWEVLLLATLRQCRDHLPGPGASHEEIDASDQSDTHKSAAHLGLDVDELLEIAWQRGHSWLPRGE